MWRTKRKEEFSASLSSDTGRPLVTLLFLFFHFRSKSLYLDATNYYYWLRVSNSKKFGTKGLKTPINVLLCCLTHSETQAI